jgi:hypothetical protein
MEANEKHAREEGYADGWFDGLEGRTSQTKQESADCRIGREQRAYCAGYELGFMAGRIHRRTLPHTVRQNIHDFRGHDDQDFERD